MEEKLPLAAALKYMKENSAPILLEKGKGEIAKNMIKVAQQSGIPVNKNDLVGYLMEVEKSCEIDEDLYDAVAKIYSSLIETDKRYKL